MSLKPKAPADEPQEKADEPRFYVGSYVLETLTTGMYTEPRDCIREYIQNSLDAIDAARQTKLLAPHEGTVKVIVRSTDGGAITIRDDGVSIPSELAWETLTSIGASRKNPRRQAGFRGIGRLAGIAYCNQLTFVCKAADENVTTTISYDCEAIRKALREGGSELEPVFKRSITIDAQPSTSALQDHYTEVRLTGIADAPTEIQSIERIADYLKSVGPIDFRDSWTSATEIKRKAEEAGFAIPTIKLLIGADEDSLDELRKPYLGATQAGRKKVSPIRKIVFFEGGAHSTSRWWGWHGDMPLLGIVNDPGVAGIRIRVKNLQLDGSEIIARILEKHASSYARFASWHLGEIYVDGDSIVPNARRDGFEDSVAWRVVEAQVAEALKPLVQSAYAASGKRNSRAFKQVNENVRREIQDIETALSETENKAVDSADRKKAIGRDIKGALRRIERLNFDDYDEKQQRTLREASVKLRNLAEKAAIKIKPTKQRSQTEEDADEIPYREFLDIVFEVLNPLLDTRTFNKVRKALIERFKE